MKSIKQLHDIDLINKITELSKVANNENSSINDIKKSISEMRTIVNHTGLIFQTAQNIFNKTFDSLSNIIDKLNDSEDELAEYSNEWIKFMHQSYSNIDEKFELDSPKIMITENLGIKKVDWIKNENNKICVKINDIVISIPWSDIRDLTFDYSPDLLRKKFKNSRHIGPISSLENDITRIKNHPLLFKIEQNKIKSHIVYNLLLYLLLC